METAERFLDAVQSTFESLAKMPKVGSLCALRKPALRRIRRWPVKGFENWLIFYQPRRNGVEIVHVIHGAREIERSARRLAGRICGRLGKGRQTVGVRGSHPYK